MPFFGPPPSDLPPPSPRSSQTQSRSVFDMDGLRVEFDRSEYEPETGFIRFTGQVKATYGETTLTCAGLTVDQEKRIGRATGRVLLVDPEGRLEAEDFEFLWLGKDEVIPEGEIRTLGSATQAYVSIGRVRLWGKKLTITNREWRLEEAEGTFDEASKPNWKISARVVKLIPGVRGSAEHVYLRAIGGIKLGPLPRYGFILNRRLGGFSPPSFKGDRGKGYGVAWSTQFPLSDQSVLGASWSVFQNQPSSFNFEYATSRLDYDQTLAKIVPNNELAERFDESWFEKITVRSPESELGDLKQRRSAWSVASRWNIGASGRTQAINTISKPIEAAFEYGGPLGQGGYKLQLRGHQIRSEANQAFRARVQALASYKTQEFQIANSFSFSSRADMMAFASSDNTYGWVRLQSGVVWKPNSQWALGASYAYGAGSGRPDFFFDELVTRESVSFRIDYKSGPYSAKWLWKYDPSRSSIYDREYELAWQWGPIEPFVLYRQFPSDYQFGFRFLITDFTNKLVNRTQQRRG